MTRRINQGEATGAKVQNAEFLASDVVKSTSRPEWAAQDSLLRIEIISTNVLVQITYDGGDNWETLGTPAAATPTTYERIIRTDDEVNFRTNDAAGITLTRFRCSEILG